MGWVNSEDDDGDTCTKAVLLDVLSLDALALLLTGELLSSCKPAAALSLAHQVASCLLTFARVACVPTLA